MNETWWQNTGLIFQVRVFFFTRIMVRYVFTIPLLAVLAGISLWTMEAAVGLQGMQWEQNAVVLVVVLLIPVFRPWSE